jgi:hypothetical protein
MYLVRIYGRNILYQWTWKNARTLDWSSYGILQASEYSYAICYTGWAVFAMPLTSVLLLDKI